jgi:ribonuclease HI
MIILEGDVVEAGLNLTVFIDGASKGNPGRAAAGVCVTDRGGKRLVALGRYLGNKTNNEAEYWALLIGIREARRLGGARVRVYTDSELIARQVKGLYRVKDLKLKPLHKAVLQNVKGFSSFEIESIPREQNQEADRLANEAIQRRITAEQSGKGAQEGTDGRSS